MERITKQQISEAVRSAGSPVLSMKRVFLVSHSFNFAWLALLFNMGPRKPHLHRSTGLGQLSILRVSGSELRIR
jgi:hypothetical protein